MMEIVVYGGSILTVIGSFKALVVTPLSNTIKDLSNSISQIDRDTRAEFKAVDAKIELIEKRVNEVDKQCIINTQSLKSFHHRLDEMKKGDKL